MGVISISPLYKKMFTADVIIDNKKIKVDLMRMLELSERFSADGPLNICAILQHANPDVKIGDILLKNSFEPTHFSLKSVLYDGDYIDRPEMDESLGAYLLSMCHVLNDDDTTPAQRFIFKFSRSIIPALLSHLNV